MKNELALRISKQFNLPAAVTSEISYVLNCKDNTNKTKRSLSQNSIYESRDYQVLMMSHRKFKMVIMRATILTLPVTPLLSQGWKRPNATVKDSGHVHGRKKGGGEEGVQRNNFFNYIPPDR